jgi:hypothetical protein
MKHSTIFAALIISLAILLNGYLDRKAHSPSFTRPSEREIRSVVVDSFQRAFAATGDNIIMQKKRDIREVRIRGVHYSDGDTRMIVDFTLVCSDGDMVSSGIGLNRDEFGTYRGVWDIGQKQARFEIHPKV